MDIIRQNPEDFVIASSSTLKDALVAITHNRKGSLVVVDGEERYLGVVSDGDIRRAMVKGATEFTPVEKFVNLNGVFVKKDATDDVLQEMFLSRPEILLIPIVNDDQRVESIALKG